MLILMRAGNSEDEFRFLLKAATEKTKKQKCALFWAISALSVMAEALVAYEFNANDRQRFVLARILSNMNEKDFDSILVSMAAFAQVGFHRSDMLTKALEKHHIKLLVGMKAQVKAQMMAQQVLFLVTKMVLSVCLKKIREAMVKAKKVIARAAETKLSALRVKDEFLEPNASRLRHSSE